MVDYAFYKNTYKGSSITLQDWPMLASRAQETLNHYKRIFTVTPPEDTSEAMAVCAMADTLDFFSQAQSGHGAVTSASIGSVSVSYGNASAVDLSPKGQERELLRSARRYLDIYRGVC